MLVLERRAEKEAGFLNLISFIYRQVLDQVVSEATRDRVKSFTILLQWDFLKSKLTDNGVVIAHHQ